MSDYHQFGEPSGAGFIDTHFDFTRCQRPDGSFYGTGGVCRKGAQSGAKEKEAKSSGGSSVKEVKALDTAAKAADKKANAADKKFQKSKSKADQKAARAADKEAKAANKAADKAAKGLEKMRSQDAKLKAAEAKVVAQLKTAKSDSRRKTLSTKRASISEARNKLKYAMAGTGTGQSALTGAQVRAAVGTAD